MSKSTSSTKTSKPVTKKTGALKIYNAMMRRKNQKTSRKDGVAKMVATLDLTPGAAATYWQNCKSGRWA